MRQPICAVIATVALTALLPASAQEEPLVVKVKASIDRGVRYLKEIQRPDGSWEVNLADGRMHGGWSSLALLALLNAGVPVQDVHVARGLKYVRGLEPIGTYVRALQTMVFVEAGKIEDRQR